MKRISKADRVERSLKNMRHKSYGVVAKLAELAVKFEYRPLKYS